MGAKKAEKLAGGDGTALLERRSSAPGRLRSAIDNQRSEFLRLCRARIKPEDVGLLVGRHARTDGLRREDVAALSGVSVSWYTWLEQGRHIRVSDEVLDRLCETLRLSEDERTYLFSLVQHRAPRVHVESEPEVPPDVVRMIHAVELPSIAMNLRWDVLAWNALNTVIYRDYSKLPAGERNLLEILFTKPVRHMSPAQQEEVAHRLCARLRYDYSRADGDPRFEALVRRLNANSPLFNRIWRMPEFTLRAYGVHHFTHARFGPLSLEHTSFVPDGYPSIRVVVCIPEDAATKRVIKQIVAEQG